ncbi:hypothetical protein ACFWFF_01445 [Streptomyces sp. NPDC060223]|uniref:hypothetical protein n=1 Tax=unclassified Streptomyces TaxID=2593676 RepID=UPI00362F0D1E
MRRLTHTLACLYALVACGLVRCAMVSAENGAPHYTAFFAAGAILLSTAIAHHAYHRDELRAALVRLERASRPPATPATDMVVAVAMAGWCCDAWAATAGRDHDPTQCTRKDQTT